MNSIITKIKAFFVKLYNKLVKNKYIKYIFAGFLFFLILIFFISSFKKTKINSTDTIDNVDTNYKSDSTISSYQAELENRLERLISAINGVKSAKVYVNIASSSTLIIAEEKEEKSITNGQNTTTTISVNPIIVKNGSSSSVIILGEIAPEINGIVVVASGADNPNVKLKILNVIKALYEIESNRIEIVEG